jgi:excisionase family DNA binding protein
MTEDLSAEVRLPDLLSVVELAEYLGVPVSTIHYWSSKGLGPPALKLGKQLRFRTADVARWLEEKTAVAPEMREAGFPASEPLADENVDGHGNTAA